MNSTYCPGFSGPTGEAAVYTRLPKVHLDESRTQGLDRLELIRSLEAAWTLTVHHGSLANLLGINALRALLGGWDTDRRPMDR